MSTFQLLLLSLIQAVSEFLPISSSGHLNLFQSLFGLQPSLVLDVFLNTATLFSVLFYFRKPILRLFQQTASLESCALQQLKFLFIATLPALVFGLFFNRFPRLITNNHLLPFTFLTTGLLLFFTRYILIRDQKLTSQKALLIGFFQALAILPGLSRSGLTIFASLLAGLSLAKSFEFSFLLFIPVSFGALILNLPSFDSLGSPNPLSLILSFVLTFLVGLFSLSFLRKQLKAQRLWLFSFYCFFIALVSFLTTFSY
jgi:undecaprenyl-diphosphatase